MGLNIKTTALQSRALCVRKRENHEQSRYSGDTHTRRQFYFQAGHRLDQGGLVSHVSMGAKVGQSKNVDAGGLRQVICF